MQWLIRVPTLVKDLTAAEVATSGEAQLLVGLKALDALPATRVQAQRQP
ncbi:MAG: hypothetical protein ACOYNY_03605 [Caldilineaceae bacterium]